MEDLEGLKVRLENVITATKELDTFMESECFSKVSTEECELYEQLLELNERHVKVLKELISLTKLL